MTAEFAAVIPAVLLVLASCLCAIQIVGQNVRMADAAADGARSLARGDRGGVAAARIHESVPGVGIATEEDGGFVCVRLSAPAAFGPAGSLGIEITARGCALAGGL